MGRPRNELTHDAPAGGMEKTLAPAFVEVLSAAGVRAPEWVITTSDDDGLWLVATPQAASLPSQGWKLHLSATVHTARDLLAKALEVLAAERAAFKVARSVEALAALNEGREGLSQIGKFITVYPTGEEEAVHLARTLDTRTRSLGGPPVPSDRRLGSSSAVHYRYGGFDGRVLQLPYGEIVPAIAEPDGTLVPDRRTAAYAAPTWVDDPFMLSGLSRGSGRPSLVLEERFVLGTMLHHTPRGKIFLALDLDESRRVIVKQAARGAAISADGRDARDQLRNEHAVLERLRADPGFPETYALLSRDDEVFLVMEDIPGKTLAEHVEAVRARGCFLAPAQVRTWALAVGRAIAAMHRHGLIHRDIKPTNVIVAADGQVRLIDLELAHDAGDPRPALGLGSPGYMSPAQAAGARPSLADDVYGIGALVYFLATGADPGQTPRANPLVDRPPRALNPSLPGWLESIIERCLAEDPAARIADVSNLVNELSAPAGREAARAAACNDPEPPVDPAGLARDLVRSLVRDVRPAVGAPGVVWTSRRYAARGIPVRDLNTGSAGVVLALADLVVDGDEDATRALREGAAWLAHVVLPGAGPAPGLYVGDSGVALALLRAGQRLESSALVTAALKTARQIATMPMVSPDLFNGTAGRLLAHLVLWEATGADDQLAAARACGDGLVGEAVGTAADEAKWAIPDGYGGLSGKIHAGYSHGAAGIADSLLDLYDVTGDERYAETARRAAHWLTRIAVPATVSGTGLEWPVAEDGEPVGPFWCHGAGGVARFFLHAARADLVPGAIETAKAAAHTVIVGGRACGPTRCHGLAGSIELMLDMQQATGDAAYGGEARHLARLLLAFSVEQAGALWWTSDQPDAIEPGYMIGSAGVALSLARLAEPARPHQLSLEGFRRRPSAA